MKKENHQHAKDKKGAIDERYIQLTLHVCRIFYSLTRPEVQVHSFAEYGKRPAYQCLTGYHGCYSGHYHANEKEFPRHDGIKRIYPFMQTVTVLYYPSTLTQIIQNKHNFYESPAYTDIFYAAMS